MNVWQTKSLKDVASKIGDGLHSTPRYVESSDYWFINGNNIRDGYVVILSGTKMVEEAEHARYKVDIDNSTILMSINGTIGSLAYYRGERVVLGKSAAYINCSNKILRKYLFAILSSTVTQSYFKNGLTGSTIKNLSLKTLRGTPILLPNIEEQHRIVSVLETWDEYLELLDKKIALKERSKKGLMQHLFGQGLKFNDKIQCSTKKLGELIKELPKSGRMSSEGKPTGDYPFFNNSTQPFARYLNRFDYDTEAIICNTGGVAYFDYYKGKFATMSDCFVFETNICTGYLYYNLKQIERRINHVGFAGSGIRHLEKRYFRKIKITLPNRKEDQSKIYQCLSDIDEQINQIKQKSKLVRDQKKYLLKNLISGTIRTPENLKLKEANNA